MELEGLQQDVKLEGSLKGELEYGCKWYFVFQKMLDGL
jgi:hypothetical protein